MWGLTLLVIFKKVVVIVFGIERVCKIHKGVLNLSHLSMRKALTCEMNPALMIHFASSLSMVFNATSIMLSMSPKQGLSVFVFLIKATLGSMKVLPTKFFQPILIKNTSSNDDCFLGFSRPPNNPHLIDNHVQRCLFNLYNRLHQNEEGTLSSIDYFQ
jgi:hypothetical protein